MIRSVFAAAALLLFCVTAAFAQSPWPEECRLVQVGSFPITLKNARILVPVQVNGRTLNFLVDTGGFASAINASVAAELGMEKHTIAHMRILDMGGKSATSYVRAATFGLANITAQNFELMVGADDPTADGVLAPDVLLRYDVEFDFAAGRMNLFRPHPCEGRAVYWGAGYTMLPFDDLDSGHVRVKVDIDGHETRAILDTGSPASFMGIKSATDLLDIDPATLAPVGKVYGGSGGELDAFYTPIKSLNMGGVNVANPHIFLTDRGAYVRNEFAALLLGMNVLRHLHMYFAYKEHRLYISG